MKDSNPSDYFRFILKRYRHEKGLTQEQLSERIGISNSFLGMIETGRKRPNIDMLFRIATAWKYDRAPSLLRWKKKFQSKKKRQKAPFPGLSFFCELLPAKCKKNDSRAISGLKIAMLRKAPLRCSLGQSAFWGRVGYVDEDFLSECFCFLGRAEGVEF